jgi:hypothetical protein
LSLILDAGALIAYERGSRIVQGHLELARSAKNPVKTTTAVVAQVWRHASRQVVLAKLLRGLDEVAFSPSRARAAGILLGVARKEDVVDVSLIEIAVDGDEILTSDPKDLNPLASASGKTLIVTRVS